MGASLPCNSEEPDIDLTRSPPPLLPGAASLSPPPFLAGGASFGTPGEFRPAKNIDDNRVAGAGETGGEEGNGVEESTTGRLVRLISEKASRAEAKSALLVKRVAELEDKLEEAQSWKVAVDEAAGQVAIAAARQQRHGGEAKKQKSGIPTKGNI